MVSLPKGVRKADDEVLSIPRRPPAHVHPLPQRGGRAARVQETSEPQAELLAHHAVRPDLMHLVEVEGVHGHPLLQLLRGKNGAGQWENIPAQQRLALLERFLRPTALQILQSLRQALVCLQRKVGSVGAAETHIARRPQLAICQHVRALQARLKTRRSLAPA